LENVAYLDSFTGKNCTVLSVELYCIRGAFSLISRLKALEKPNARDFKPLSLLIAVLWVLALFPSSAAQIQVQEAGYCIDLPEGWGPVESYNRDSNNMNLSFSNKAYTAFLNIIAFSPDSFGKAKDMFNYVKTQLKASGEGASFLFSGENAFFAELRFKSSGKDHRGYFIFINSDKRNSFDYALLCFSTVKDYTKNHDSLLSALDSFANGEALKLFPGPVSQFYYPVNYLFTDAASINSSRIRKTDIIVPVQIGEERYVLPFDSREIDATKVVVDREARILSAYKTESREAMNAWKRFYRVIYRDNFHRLDKLYSILFKDKEQDVKANRVSLAAGMLKFVQGFKYIRTATTADLLSPLSAASRLSGDCDSRGLLYLILLHHIDIDSVLLVSTRYHHSAVGVGIVGRGAKINFEGRNYMYAEVTDNVAIGQVPKSMADPSGWIPIKLGYSK